MTGRSGRLARRRGPPTERASRLPPAGSMPGGAAGRDSPRPAKSRDRPRPRRGEAGGRARGVPRFSVFAPPAPRARRVGSRGRGQPEESLDTPPRWPSRYRGGIIVPGEVTAVDPEQGTATVKTDTG